MKPPAPRWREPVECPHCGEATLPNLLADGALVCSCGAGRSLPAGDMPAIGLVSSRPREG